MLSSTADLSSRMRRMRRSLHVICFFLCALVIAELVFRLFGIGYPLFTQNDEWTGFALRPGTAGWVQEGETTYVSINSAGMRDHEHAKEKPANTVRIAVLGDAYAEARQVDIENTFWSVMEKELGQCAQRQGKQVEVLNFGVSGFTTAQELLHLHTRVWEFNPDVVLLAFNAEENVRGNSAALSGMHDRPLMSMNDGNLTIDLSFRDQPSYRKQSSPLASLKLHTLQRSRIAQIAGYVLTRPRGAANDDGSVYKQTTSSQWTEAWNITETILRQMHGEVKGHGAKFIIVTVSSNIQAHPDRSRRGATAKALGVPDLFGPDRRIAMLGAEDGFTVLNLAEAFSNLAQEQRLFLHGKDGEGYWNARGHQEAGKTIATVVCGGGFLEE